MAATQLLTMHDKSAMAAPSPALQEVNTYITGTMNCNYDIMIRWLCGCSAIMVIRGSLVTVKQQKVHTLNGHILMCSHNMHLSHSLAMPTIIGFVF